MHLGIDDGVVVLHVDSQSKGIQSGLQIVLVHAITLLHPLVRHVLLYIWGVFLHRGRAGLIIPEQNGPVGVGKVGDAVLGAFIPALLANLRQQCINSDGPKPFVVVSK